MNGNINAKLENQTLIHHLRPTRLHLIGNIFIFQHHNFPKHQCSKSYMVSSTLKQCVVIFTESRIKFRKQRRVFKKRQEVWGTIPEDLSEISKLFLSYMLQLFRICRNEKIAWDFCTVLYYSIIQMYIYWEEFLWPLQQLDYSWWSILKWVIVFCCSVANSD